MDLDALCEFWRRWNWQSPLNGLIESISRINKFSYAQKWFLRSTHTSHLLFDADESDIYAVSAFFIVSFRFIRTNNVNKLWFIDIPEIVLHRFGFSFEWIVFLCTGKKASSELCTHTIAFNLSRCVKSVMCKSVHRHRRHSTEMMCFVIRFFAVVVVSFSLLLLLYWLYCYSCCAACALGLESFFIKLCTVQYLSQSVSPPHSIPKQNRTSCSAVQSRKVGILARQPYTV